MGVPDDPEVLNVLQEMEQEVKTATAAAKAPMHQMAPPMMPQMMMAPPAQFQIKRAQPSSGLAKWVNYDIMQRAGVIAAIAVIAFYPKTLETVYSSFPQVAFLQKFDIIVRATLLAIVVYLATIQFDI
jgi:hypothetical protein